ncbi:MAG: acetate/propionate family kinase [Rubrivivax sp.]|nr:acetate/propionate family kinase [Rubrivivax sp.]
MRILALNAGSSTLKAGVFDMPSAHALVEVTVDCGVIDDAALDRIEQRLADAGIAVKTLDAVAHRVAHGGPRLREAVRIDDEAEREIERAAVWVPQHNPVALAGIRLARRRWPGLAQVAVFDTTFHATLPEHAALYAVPQAWRDAGVRRYGFHGMAHQHVMEAAAAALERDANTLRIVSCHIGNGASVCAIDRGRSVDTSMGLTALEGLIMGTRSGDVDPGAVLFVSKHLGLAAAEVERALYEDSGLKALSGAGGDLRDVERRAAEGHADAQTALRAYAYRVRKTIGAYAAALGGIDVLAFTGGAGENSPALRRRIVDGLEFLGVRLDEDRNNAYRAAETPMAALQPDNAPVVVLAVHAEEQAMIARAAQGALSGGSVPATAPVAIPVAVSAHHVHLTQETVERLFGAGHALQVRQPLTQPGFWAAEETVAVAGPRGRLERVRVLGPCRSRNQIELSRTEAIRLGIDAPLRLSGHLDGTPEVTLIGPSGSVRTDGAIVAQRHLHLAPADAARLGVEAGQEVDLELDTARATVLRHVALRLADDAVLEVHLDTDEANAAGLSGDAEGVLRRCPGCAARLRAVHPTAAHCAPTARGARNDQT